MIFCIYFLASSRIGTPNPELTHRILPIFMPLIAVTLITDPCEGTSMPMFASIAEGLLAYSPCLNSLRTQ